MSARADSQRERNRHAVVPIAPSHMIHLQVLSEHAQRALYSLTAGHFEEATQRLNIRATTIAVRPEPSSGDMYYYAAFMRLCDDVLKPLFEGVWDSVRQCLDAEGQRVQPETYSELYRYGLQWADECGRWIVRGLLARFRRVLDDSQYGRAVRTIVRLRRGAVGAAFNKHFLQKLSVTHELQQAAHASQPSADARSFMPAGQALQLWGRADEYKALWKAIGANPWIRVDRNNPNRPRIHAGDWAAFLRLQAKGKVDARTLVATLPPDVLDDLVDQRINEVEARKAEMRRQEP